MLTRCPSCLTTFRITPEQLKARQGRVRCGQCQKVFNAIETLAETTVGAPRETNTGAETGMAPLPAPTVASATLDETPPPADVTQSVAVAEATVAPAIEDTAIPAGEPRLPSESDDESAFETLLPEEIPARRWPWVLGITFALLGLGAQAAYHFRTEVAVLAPEAKPAMLQLCVALGCDVPLPRKADLISIETSDLHPDASNPGQLQLSASLKNRAPFGQTYPHLELTLTDTTDKALLRRVLAPVDYLPRAKATSQTFAAGSDLAINLALEVKDAAPVGYRLYVFYP